MPSSRIDANNDDIKPVLETIMDPKGIATRHTYEKARVAKCATKYVMEYCVPFEILPRIGQIVLLKKELFEVERIGLIAKFQLKWTMHPCKRGTPT